MSQFGLIRTIRVMNEKSYYLEYDTTFSAEQAIKIKNLTIDNQPVYCCSLITPPGLEIPSGSSFSRTNPTGQVLFELHNLPVKSILRLGVSDQSVNSN